MHSPAEVSPSCGKLVIVDCPDFGCVDRPHVRFVARFGLPIIDAPLLATTGYPTMFDTSDCAIALDVVFALQLLGQLRMGLRAAL